MREARFKLASLRLAIAVLALAGCSAAPGAHPLTEDELSLKRASETKLINEGGPVFAMPGEVILPSYYAGSSQGLVVTAERISGSMLQSIESVNVGIDGSFGMRIPQNAEMFFATTVVTHEDALHRIRALVRPEEGAAITIDTVSTLVAAKIMLARESNRMAQLSGLYDQTADLTGYARSVIAPATVGAIRLDASNRELSLRLDGLATDRPDLAYKLHAWEEALKASSTPTAAGTTPEPMVTMPIDAPQPK